MKVSINAMHIFAVVAPTALLYFGLPWYVWACATVLAMAGAIICTRFIEEIELAKKAQEESRHTETKELRVLVESYDRFVRKIGAAAKENGLAVVFDDEVYDNPEYTGSVWVIGSGSTIKQSVHGQKITLAPRSNNGYYITAIDPAMFSRGRSAFDCYPPTDIAPSLSVEIKP
jgi:hypothetical protein